MFMTFYCSVLKYYFIVTYFLLFINLKTLMTCIIVLLNKSTILYNLYIFNKREYILKII